VGGGIALRFQSGARGPPPLSFGVRHINMLRGLKVALAVTGLMFLLACGRSNTVSPTAFAIIAGPRNVVEATLKDAQATPLRSSNDVLIARLATQQLNQPMNVTLTFKDGKLEAVNYWPPTPVRDWVLTTRLGPFGYRSFAEKTATRTLRDRYLFLGSLGRLHLGSGGLVIQPTRTAFIFRTAIVAVVLGSVGVVALTRRKFTE
jgi:hypothetical protein